jgi:O-antigen ligase
MWPRIKPPLLKGLMAFILLFLAVYVHILASKSGMIALYLFLGGLGIYYTVARRSIYGIAIIVGLPVLLGLGIKYIPTLHERKVHIVYTYYRFKSHDKSGNLGDLSRLMSYDLSFKLIGEHPIAGVGVGDMLDEMKKGYARWYPEVKDEHSMLIPHNQFLTAGLGVGIPGLIIFTLWVFMPLRRLGRNRESFFFFVVWLALFVQLMIEPFLEAQFGLFVYIFFLLLFRHVLPEQKQTGETEVA